MLLTGLLSLSHTNILYKSYMKQEHESKKDVFFTRFTLSREIRHSYKILAHVALYLLQTSITFL